MENHIKKIDTSCVACSKKSFDFFANKNNFDLYRCKNCGLIFVWPIPQSTNDLYSQDYFDGAKHGFGYVNYEEDKSTMSETFNVYLQKIEQFALNKGKLLDIGAATGFFAQLALARGWDANGIEVSDYAANIARQKGLNVISGTLESANFNPASFDVVTLWDVIEHLTDPPSSIKIIHSILKEGGIVVINTPDSSSLTAKILGKRWHLLVPPEHLFYFNRKGLAELLKHNGFEVVYTDKIGKKFTMQYIFQTLSRWQNFFIWRHLSDFFSKTRLGRLGIPINLRDNFFIIARKK